MVLEFLGGLASNSLALMADAGHMLTDVGATGLALFAAWFAEHPASQQKTYGYYRLEILAAFVNGIVLVLIAGWIIYEAFLRLHQPLMVKGNILTLVAFGGLLVNLVSAGVLMKTAASHVNTRAVLTHIFSDVLGALGAIIAGVGILFFHAGWLDPFVSILIALLVLYSAWKLIEETTHLLLEGCPRHLSVEEIESALTGLHEIRAVHDLHVWSITQGKEALSVHIVVDEEEHYCPQLVSKIQDILKQKFGLTHLTIQLETPDFEEAEIHF